MQEVAAAAAPSCGDDIEALIDGFLQDPSQAELELPTSLTAEQRKRARRLADQHSGLKCESYGFGAERKLYLFKKGTQALPGEETPSSGGAVRVKNTFIDDWVPAEGGDGEAEPLCFRSMPVALLERTLQRCMVAQPGTAPLPESVASSTSAGAEQCGQTGSSPPESCNASYAPELPALPEALQVRNTFIHIESMPVVERIVQSMPDGMFRQCLQAELNAQGDLPSAAAAPEVPPTPSIPPAPAEVPVAPPGPMPPYSAPAPPGSMPPSLAAPTEGDMIPPGTEVIIHNLVKLPDFNGLTGVVQALDPDTGRYDVLLERPTGSCGWKWVKVKGDNLQLKMPPPPRNAPTLSSDIDVQAEVGQPPLAPPSEGGMVPPTPTWDDVGVGDPSRQGMGKPPLKLNALV